MNIIEAMDAMDEGKKVRHFSFASTSYCAKVGIAYMRDSEFLVSLGLSAAMLRDGWTVVKESFDFERARGLVQLGIHVRRAAWPDGEKMDGFDKQITLADTMAMDWEEV